MSKHQSLAMLELGTTMTVRCSVEANAAGLSPWLARPCRWRNNQGKRRRNRFPFALTFYTHLLSPPLRTCIRPLPFIPSRMQHYLSPNLQPLNLPQIVPQESNILDADILVDAPNLVRTHRQQSDREGVLFPVRVDGDGGTGGDVVRGRGEVAGGGGDAGAVDGVGSKRRGEREGRGGRMRGEEGKINDGGRGKIRSATNTKARRGQ